MKVPATMVFSFLTFVAAVPAGAQNYNFQLVECGKYAARPLGMNNAGTVVGAAYNSSTPATLAFIYTNGSCQTSPVSANGAAYLGITNSGDIFGELRGPTVPPFIYLAKGTTIIPLPAYPGANTTYYSYLTSAGILGGNYLLPATAYAFGFLYQNGQFTPIPDGGTGEAPMLQGLNDTGIAVGTLKGLKIGGFIFQNAKLTLLEFPGASATTFNGINSNGLVVGTYYSNNTGAGGVFTLDVNTMAWTDLHFPSQYQFVDPVGINNSGVIAAWDDKTTGLLLASPK